MSHTPGFGIAGSVQRVGGRRQGPHPEACRCPRRRPVLQSRVPCAQQGWTPTGIPGTGCPARPQRRQTRRDLWVGAAHGDRQAALEPRVCAARTPLRCSGCCCRPGRGTNETVVRVTKKKHLLLSSSMSEFCIQRVVFDVSAIYFPRLLP
ncbi:uncharacterized protein LOC144332162 [Macaca mulatta]